MNTDRCYHIPTSEGQSMCTCEDNRMWLELTIECMARHIATLERRLQRHKPQVIVGHNCQMTIPNQVPSKRPDPVGPVAD